MPERNFPHLKLLAASHKGHYFGAFASMDENTIKGYDFFISNTVGIKDWCECMGFVHGKSCYHIQEAKKKFGESLR